MTLARGPHIRDTSSRARLDTGDVLPALDVTLTWDPDDGRWTAKATSIAAHGRGVSPGDAVDDLWFAIPDLIAVVDAMPDRTKTWEDRREALIEAAERGGLEWKD